MASKPGFVDYVSAAFNARPFGMFVAPNWVGLAAVGLLGVVNPGFWVLGAGLELGYLLTLVHQRPIPALRRCARQSIGTQHESLTRKGDLLSRSDRGQRRYADVRTARAVDPRSCRIRRRPRRRRHSRRRRPVSAG